MGLAFGKSRHLILRGPETHTKRIVMTWRQSFQKGCMIITVQRFNGGELKTRAPCAVDVGQRLQVWGRRDCVEEG